MQCQTCAPGYEYNPSAGAGQLQCRCPDGYQEVGGQCQLVCEPGYYAAGNKCDECNSTCLACNGGTQDDCTKCKTGETLVTDTFGSYCECNTSTFHVSLMSGECVPCAGDRVWDSLFQRCIHRESTDGSKQGNTRG